MKVGWRAGVNKLQGRKLNGGWLLRSDWRLVAVALAVGWLAAY